MIIQIDPLDTLFFRDGKPFRMGEETWSNSIFPPNPSVIYGALRSAYFANHIDDLGKANEEDDPTKGLKIKGIYYLIDNDIYFPLPMDCVKEKKDDDDDKPVKVSTLSMRKNDNLSNCPTEYLLFDRENRKVENVTDGLVRKSVFEKYLVNTLDNFSISKMSDYVISEPKIGIGISKKTGASDKSKLYRVDMKRLSYKNNNKISILVNFFDDLNLPEEGIIKFGGEGKAARYNRYKEKDINIDFPKFKENANQFKIVLTTSAIFKNGWLPDWIDETTLVGEFNGLKIKLLVAAIDKPIYIGGFDMKEKKPKPMFKAVPAGSVYYFELINGNMEEVKNAFHQKAISDVYSEQGFGIAYVGSVKNA